MPSQQKRRDRRQLSRRRQCQARLIFLASAILFSVWSVAVVEAAVLATGWTIDCADCPPYFGAVSPRSMQLDSEGSLHIAYGGEHLYHAWQEAGEWRSEVVDGTLDVGHPAVLAIDGSDNLHVIYYDRGGRTLRYAHRANDVWQLEQIVDDLTLADFPAAAVDGSGRVHAAYFDAGSDQLTYAYRAGDGWHFELIEPNGTGLGVSLAVDMDGIPHVSYGCEGTCYAVRDESGWRSEIVVPGDIVPPPVGEFDPRSHTSLALDDGGNPHIVFDSRDYEFEYATREGNTWSIEEVPVETDYLEHSFYFSLALGTDGVAHVSYAVVVVPPKPGRTFGARYATRDDGEWRTEFVALTTLPTLALGATGEPSYAYVSKLALYHTVKTNEAWQPDLIVAGGDAGGHATLALDPLGVPLAVSLDETSGIVRQAVRDGDEWHAERLLSLFSGIPVIEGIAYAVDNSRVEHLFALLNTGYDHEWDPVGYAFRDESGWQSSAFWPIGVRAFYEGQSIALDGMGMPHVGIGRQTSSGDASLNYGNLSPSGEWNFETIKAMVGGNSIERTSLALTRAGYPRIAFTTVDLNGDRDLNFAFKDEIGWHVESVDSRGDVGKYLFLALDSRDQPRVSYYDATNGDLCVATWDGADWHVEIVDREGDVGLFTSLAIDGQGFVHISYYDATNGDLKYARQDEAGWSIEVVDSEGDVGQYSSLVLYLGKPAIAYQDTAFRDLKVARSWTVPPDRNYLPLLHMDGVD